MTVREIEEALRKFVLDADVLIQVKGEQHHYAVDSVGRSPGGLPTIHCAELPAGKAAQRA